MTYTQYLGLGSERQTFTMVRAQQATAMNGASTVTIVLVLTLLVIAAGLALGFALHTIRLERMVTNCSSAVQGLQDLNTLSKSYLAPVGPIKHLFQVQVESLQKYHRFDLARFMRDNVLRYEEWFENEVGSRLRALELFSGYEVSVVRLAQKHLGSSGHPSIAPDRFVTIEKKLFEKQQLPQPIPSARLVAEVSYTSPAGRNSYSRRLDWDFDDLRQGLRSAQALRVRQSSAEALRARERSLMTPALRVDILRRDGFRCRMCGASADEGSTLHVDHILPVSRGGRTLPENLQALCQSCNLGKSNRFVG
jgi:hypothetical protein